MNLHCTVERGGMGAKRALSEGEVEGRERARGGAIFVFPVLRAAMDRSRRSTRKRVEREYDGESSDGETPISSTPMPSAAITTAGVRAKSSISFALPFVPLLLSLTTPLPLFHIQLTLYISSSLE